MKKIGEFMEWFVFRVNITFAKDSRPLESYKETLVCLDMKERRLSFFIDGRLVHLIQRIPVRARVAVWSKFEGLQGTLLLRTGIGPPV